MEATSILEGVHNYTDTLRREHASEYFPALKGVEFYESDKTELLFGHNLTKRIADAKASFNALKSDGSKTVKRPFKNPKGRKMGYSSSQSKKYHKNKSNQSNSSK